MGLVLLVDMVLFVFSILVVSFFWEGVGFCVLEMESLWMVMACVWIIFFFFLGFG